MTGLITLRRDAVLMPDPEPLEVEPTDRIPEVVDQDGRPLGWSIREVRGLRFFRWLAARGRIGVDDREAED